MNVRLTLMGILVLGLSIDLFSQTAPGSEDLIKQGMSLFDAGSYREAGILFEEAHARDPANAVVNFDLGTTYFLLTEYELSLGALNRAVSIDPHYAKAFSQLGVVYFQLNRFKEAVDALNRGIGFNPKDATTRYNLGCAYLRLGENKKAVRSLAIAQTLDPGNIEIRLNLAAALSLSRRSNDAIEILQGIVSENPSDATAQLLLTKIYLESKDRLSALSLYSKLKTSDPEMALRVYELICSGSVFSAKETRRRP